MLLFVLAPTLKHTHRMGWDSVLNNIEYGDRFRKHRKWLQDAFTPKPVLASYGPIQRRETYTLLSGLCESPERFFEHIGRQVPAFLEDQNGCALTILQVVWGDYLGYNIRSQGHVAERPVGGTR